MAQSALQVVKSALNANEIRTRFNEVLGEKAPQFMASITNVVANSKYLQNCDPQSIMSAAFIAASLDLPIDPNLGRAYVVPYGSKAQFIIGYKGLVEMAIRTGKYRDMNAVEVYSDELLEYNPILGKLRFVDDFTKCKQRAEGKSENIVGYYAYYELLTGFAKGLYMTKEQVIQHAEKYSQAYQKKRQDSPWFTNFDEMAKKTVLKRLLSKFAILSVGEPMAKAITEDQKVYDGFGEGQYLDNMEEPETPETDEAAEAVVEKIAEKVKAEKKKPAPAQEAAPEPTPEDEFMQFEAQFENDVPFA